MLPEIKPFLKNTIRINESTIEENEQDKNKKKKVSSFKMWLGSKKLVETNQKRYNCTTGEYPAE